MFKYLRSYSSHTHNILLTWTKCWGISLSDAAHFGALYFWSSESLLTLRTMFLLISLAAYSLFSNVYLTIPDEFLISPLPFGNMKPRITCTYRNRRKTGKKKHVYYKPARVHNAEVQCVIYTPPNVTLVTKGKTTYEILHDVYHFLQQIITSYTWELSSSQNGNYNRQIRAHFWIWLKFHLVTTGKWTLQVLNDHVVLFLLIFLNHFVESK